MPRGLVTRLRHRRSLIWLRRSAPAMSFLRIIQFPYSATRSQRISTDSSVPMFSRRFLVKIDFPKMELSLEPRPRNAEISDDTGPWTRAIRHLVSLASIDSATTSRCPRHQGGRPGVHSALFLLDSGSSANLIDTETAKESTSVSADSRITVRAFKATLIRLRWPRRSRSSSPGSGTRILVSSPSAWKK